MNQQKHPFIKVELNNNINKSNKTSKNVKASIKAKISKGENKSLDLTSKKNFKFYSNLFKIKLDLSSHQQNNNNTKEKYYWFAAYDKLIKTNKIFKIFSFYNLASKNSVALGNKNLYEEFNKIKEKKIIINNYEIFFIKGMNSKPFIRPSEGKKIHVKLYLLSMKQINMIFSYINRIEYDNYFTSFDNMSEKNKYINIFNEKNKKNINIIYPTIFYLGSFMNTKIICFSRAISENNKINSINDLEIDLIPNSKKIAKLIKLLLTNYPEYSKEYFIDYIFSYYKSIPNLNEIINNTITDKKNEINNLLLSQRKSLYKIRQGNKCSRKGIGPNFQEFSSSPIFSSMSIKNSSSNNINSNTNNNNSNSNVNLINNINNNNIGTISYNPSYFDFTSDYLFSIQQNKENLSKILDSFRSLSNRNKNSNTNNNKNKIGLSLSDNNRNSLKNYINNNNIKNQIKQQNSVMDKNSSKISNFSFENDSKIEKINVNKKINIIRDSKQLKNLFIKKDIIKNIENYSIPNVPSLLSKKSVSKNSKNSDNKKNFTSYIKRPKYALDIISRKPVHNFSINKSENKENSNIASNIGIKSVKSNNTRRDKIISSKNFFSFNANKIVLRGEDIFIKTDNNSNRQKNQSFMYILDKNGIKGFDLKNIRKSKRPRLSINI